MRLTFDPVAGLSHTPRPVSADNSRAQTVLVFDSGLGGLTVFREIIKARPDAAFVYVADFAAFPYGRLSEADVVARVMAVMERQIAQFSPDCVVIACNTASTLVLPSLRARFDIPFVGTVPAIKPACEASQSRMISVLATPGTVARDYTKGLMAEYGKDCAITLVGSPVLASLAERVMRGEKVSDAAVFAEIRPCFVEQGAARTDMVVLACTHYPLLVDMFARVAPWPVTWIDPAPAIARRVVQLLGENKGATAPGAPYAIFTKAGDEAVLRPMLLHFGLRHQHVDAMPFEKAAKASI